MKRFTILFLFLCSTLFAQSFASFYHITTDTTAQYSPVVGTPGDEAAIDAIRAKGITTPVLQYVRSDAIQDPGSCTATPKKNQAAYIRGDFCHISAQHPDWFLLDSTGARIKATNDDFYMMDWGNPGWQQFAILRISAIQSDGKFAGVFLDNVEASLAKRQQFGHLPAKYPTDAAYQAAVQSFLTAIHGTLKPTWGNVINVRTQAIWLTYVNLMDGALSEATFTGWTGYQTTAQWLADLDLVSKTIAAGKSIMAISQGDQTDTQKQSFAYASYLLVMGSGASFRYANANAYAQAWVYPNYSYAIGNPVGPMFAAANGHYVRYFDSGIVDVDPVAHVGKINLVCSN